ncbi:MAG: hypothetical protein Q7J86_07220 [Bacteroidota bacterium]|nr:hypothetical protein [Bacteroidota bacterium]
MKGSGANYKLTPELIDRSMPVIDEAAMIIMQYEIPVETIKYVSGLLKQKIFLLCGISLLHDPSTFRMWQKQPFWS